MSFQLELSVYEASPSLHSPYLFPAAVVTHVLRHVRVPVRVQEGGVQLLGLLEDKAVHNTSQHNTG